MVEIALRPATLDDVEGIAGVWHASWRDGHLGHVPDSIVSDRTLPSFRLRVPGRIAATTVATDGHGVVGFVTVHDDELEQLFVADRGRGTGVAAALLQDGEDRIAARYAVAWLAVVAGNARARAFYSRQGWSDSGPLNYEAETSTGRAIVPSHRYEKRLHP
jgi:GNAT superfamily N-acetyltransferase